MSRTYWLTLSALVAAALAVGWFLGKNSPGHNASTAPPVTAVQPKKVLYYRNPMGLPDTSPVPKKDSMGMDYLPVYEGGQDTDAPGTVVLSPERIQKLGVRTETVRLRPLSPSIRASGTVQVDETRQHVIAPKFEGWVERLHANQTGMPVRRGQPLLSVYSPELVAAQEEYRVADAAARKLAGGDPATVASMIRLRDAARARLHNWDIGDAQLANAGGKSGAAGNLVLTAPADAVVIDKPVVQGARFAAGDTILRLADLSVVWVTANVPASSARGVALGQRAMFTSPSLPGQTFEGQVSFVQPVMDPVTRTLGVRLALPNHEGMLRPGLFGDVTLFQDDATPVLSVPRSAVLDSGLRQTVLVQVSEGRFAPRPVKVGRRTGDAVEILEGVAEGERVVVSANFLIDAESNLQSAFEGMGVSQGQAGESSPTGPDTAPAIDEHAGHEMPAQAPAADAPAADAPAADERAVDEHAGHDVHGQEH